MIWIIIIGIAIVSFAVSQTLKNKFKKYSQIPTRSGMSGKEVAEKMLAEHGISNVAVVSVPGKLTDHYNPAKKTVNLSPEVYNGRSVAAAAVAAHECGHAVQHAQQYGWLQFRTALVPIQAASGKILNVLMIMMFIGVFLLKAFPFSTMLLVIIGAYTVMTLFSFVTLPVEFDASNRALAWIRNTNVVNTQEHTQAKDALKWAAMTYVVAALSSLIMLLYYLSLYLGGRD